MSCDWEGNRRYAFALAVRHRAKWFIYLRAQSLGKGDEHPANTPHGAWYSTFELFLASVRMLAMTTVARTMTNCSTHSNQRQRKLMSPKPPCVVERRMS